MESLTFSHVSIFVVTLEVAIAVISLVPLSAVFAFVAIIAWNHEGPDTFYPEENGPLFSAAFVVFTTIYILQAIQLLFGILLLKSFTLMEINLWGAVKTAWCWLISSVLTLSALCYLIYQTVVEYNSNSFFLASLITYFVQKTISLAFVLRFTVGACIFILDTYRR